MHPSTSRLLPNIMTTRVSSKRLPANYRIVHDVVRSQEPGIHARAGEIFAAAKALKPSLGYSTVYRALERLRALGLVSQLHLPGTDAAVYEPARASHAHFVCTRCGAIEDIDVDPATTEVSEAVKARCAEVQEITITVHGRCAACVAGAR